MKRLLNHWKQKIKHPKKGAISLIGIIMTISVVVFIQGYLDTMSATYILDETQSILDLTALTTVQSSVDTDGLRYERMTLRPHNYDYLKHHVNEETAKAESTKLLTGTINGSSTNDLAKYSIWFDGTNADYIKNHSKANVNKLLKDNFEYYLEEAIGNQISVDGMNIKSCEIINFNGELVFENWGINRKYNADTTTFDGKNNAPVNNKKNTFMKLPQVVINAIVQIEVDVDPTFTTAGYQIALYNARSQSSDGNKTIQESGATNYKEGTYLIDSGFNSNGNLVLTIRTMSRLTAY